MNKAIKNTHIYNHFYCLDKRYAILLALKPLVSLDLGVAVLCYNYNPLDVVLINLFMDGRSFKFELPTLLLMGLIMLELQVLLRML